MGRWVKGRLGASLGLKAWLGGEAVSSAWPRDLAGQRARLGRTWLGLPRSLAGGEGTGSGGEAPVCTAPPKGGYHLSTPFIV